MPWMGVGVYLPPAPLLSERSALATGLAVAGFFAALLGAGGFFAVARFFMARTLQRARAPVNAPAVAAGRR